MCTRAKILIPIFGIILGLIMSPTLAAKPADPTKLPITSSESYLLSVGSASLARHIEIPDCGLGRFLFESVVASPEVSVGQSADYDPALGIWAVRIPTMQRALTNQDTGVPLYLYGNGYETVSATLSPGQATFDTNLITSEIIRSLGVVVEIFGGFNVALAHKFNVHISGHCGDAYSTAVPPDTI